MKSLEDLSAWLIADGRKLGDGPAVVEGYCLRLRAAGVPISRVNIGQRFSNPLLIAWGVVWTPDKTEQYDVTHAIMETTSYVGSAFDYINTHQEPLHKSLLGLNRDTEHSSFLEFADAGGTDMFAMVIEFGDGSQHGCTFISNHPQGFSDSHLSLIQQSGDSLACAMEPITMRKSTQSLLRTYLGNGPSQAVWEGTIKRGERTSLDAVVMFTDLRGFTEKSQRWDEPDLFTALNGYFDVVVKAVEENGGDVLKFMGDGVLSIFPIPDTDTPAAQCRNAVTAARAALSGLDTLNGTRAENGDEELAFGVGINAGSVTYGNIGSPERLDFTVLGPAVNIASRVQDLCKSLGQTVLATGSVASHCPAEFSEIGHHSVRGVSDPLALFGLQQ